MILYVVVRPRPQTVDGVIWNLKIDYVDPRNWLFSSREWGNLDIYKYEIHHLNYQRGYFERRKRVILSYEIGYFQLRNALLVFWTTNYMEWVILNFGIGWLGAMEWITNIFRYRFSYAIILTSYVYIRYIIDGYFAYYELRNRLCWNTNWNSIVAGLWTHIILSACLLPTSLQLYDVIVNKLITVTLNSH